jgi:acyl dehydratase
MDALYLDDLSVGQRFVSGAHTMDGGEITRFAADYDPQPFHMDDMAARDSRRYPARGMRGA